MIHKDQKSIRFESGEEGGHISLSLNPLKFSLHQDWTFLAVQEGALSCWKMCGPYHIFSSIHGLISIFNMSKVIYLVIPLWEGLFLPHDEFWLDRVA